MVRPDRPRRPAGPASRSVVALFVLVPAVASCTESASPGTTPAQYADELAAVCTTTGEAFAALAPPTDDAAAREFAASAASLLQAEADAVRRLAVPDELDDDHRAFVLNTDDQARTWERLAETPSTDAAFGELTRTIGELTLGRDDLVGEMGVDACRRATT